MGYGAPRRCREGEAQSRQGAREAESRASRGRCRSRWRMMDIGTALSHPEMFASSFVGPSWDPWRAVVRGAFALPMTRSELELFRSVADRDPPKRQVREFWAIIGARGGKDSAASAVGTHVAASFDGRGLRPGERALCALLAVDKNQSDIVLGYIR